MSERWEPVEDGEIGVVVVALNGGEIGILKNPDDPDPISRYSWSDWLPDNIRLCRQVDAAPAVEMTSDVRETIEMVLRFAKRDGNDSTALAINKRIDTALAWLKEIEGTNGR